MTPSSPSQPATPAPDYAALWSSARKLYPIYVEMSREFAVEAPGFAGLEEPADSPDKETVEQAQKWLNEMDERIQVHQLRQFLSPEKPEFFPTLFFIFIQAAEHLLR